METMDMLRFLKTTPKPNPRYNQTIQLQSPPPERKCAPHHARPRPFNQIASDRFSQELAPDAAIWTMYVDEAHEYDNDMVRARQQSLDTLLFIHPNRSAVPALTHWVNRLWILSLTLALSGALIAVSGKERLTKFHLASRPSFPKKLALLRQSRLEELEHYWALYIAALLPTLLHLSLVGFLTGLVVYLYTTGYLVPGSVFLMLALYVASLLGATHKYQPFVPELFNYTLTTAESIFNLWTKPRPKPATCLDALVWLANHARDQIVVDCAYQAMAGLRDSPYLCSFSPSSSMDPVRPDLETIYSTLFERFEQLIAGTLETGSVDPPVGRYIHAVIVLSLARASIVKRPTSWFDLLNKINCMWISDLPIASMSGNTFVSALVAEMDVIQLCMEEASAVDTANQTDSSDSIVEKWPLAGDSHELQLHICQWLNTVSGLFVHHSQGTAHIDSYLIGALLRASKDAAYFMSRTSSIRGLAGDESTAPQFELPSNLEISLPSLSKRLDQLLVLISILRHCPNPSQIEGVQACAELFKTYLTITPPIICLLIGEEANQAEIFNAFSFFPIDKPPTSRRDILFISVRSMMLTSAYLCGLLPTTTHYPQCPKLVDEALELAHASLNEDNVFSVDHLGPYDALGYHLDDFISILEFFGTNEHNLNLISPAAAAHLCVIGCGKIGAGLYASTHYMPPECLPTLLDLSIHGRLAKESAKCMLGTILTRLRSPFDYFGELPEHLVPIVPAQPPIEHLRQMTRFPNFFKSLQGVIQMIDSSYCHDGGALSAAAFLQVAAGRDSSIVVEPVELGPDAVPGFLDLVVLLFFENKARFCASHYHEIIISMAILITAAAKDTDSMGIISRHSAPATVLDELNKLKPGDSLYKAVIPMEEQKRLMNALACVKHDIPPMPNGEWPEYLDGIWKGIDIIANFGKTSRRSLGLGNRRPSSESACPSSSKSESLEVENKYQELSNNDFKLLINDQEPPNKDQKLSSKDQELPNKDKELSIIVHSS
ncbi:unnamed protein product [Rhizoctonia solani]|uniref:DUF6535 domain-containing protein n=1 Tax=Rhizoctonia solani TaxID=456999 RepID=A0A8H3D3T8_9AGAM|nr:unnamed protein product [Rhizoctonia solani]